MAPRYGVYSCFAGYNNYAIPPENRAAGDPFDPRERNPYNPDDKSLKPGITNGQEIATAFNSNFPALQKQLADMCKCCTHGVELRLYFGNFRERTPDFTPVPFKEWK
jgi:hypothetical protein